MESMYQKAVCKRQFDLNLKRFMLLLREVAGSLQRSQTAISKSWGIFLVCVYVYIYR